MLTTLTILTLVAFAYLFLYAGITKQTLSITYGRVASAVAPMVFGDKGIVDNAFGANPAIAYALGNFLRKPLGGAERIFFPVRLDKRPGEGSYQDLDNISIVRPDVRTSGQVQTKEYARNVTISRRDSDLVRGQRAVANLIAIEMEDALTTIMDDLNQDLFEDGSGNSSKILEGWASWIALDPTSGANAPGGISQLANTNWRNQFQDNDNTAADVLSDLRTLLTNAKSGNRGPRQGICNRAFRNVVEADMADTFQHNPVIMPGQANAPLVGKSGDPSIGTVFIRGIPITEDEDAALASGGSSFCFFIDPTTFVIVDATQGPKRADVIEFVEMVRLGAQTAEVGFMRAHLAVFCVERRRNALFFDGPAA